MLTQRYKLTPHPLYGNEIIQVASLSLFEAKFFGAGSEWSDLVNGAQWQGDPERFQLIANETVKIGPLVSRADADYWIEMIRARALGVGEDVGRVKVY